MILILSSSLNPDSNSRILAAEARRVLQAEGHETVWVDLRDFPLPFCDSATAYSHPNVARLNELLRNAEAVIVATPIYNYDATAALKNVIELTGAAWENKVVGFLCAAGGMSSYMSILSLANSLMLDFRSVIVPRFVYATGEAFASGGVVDVEIIRRIADLARMTARLSGALVAA
ncbi:MAG TPA: NAD(P)H-dependent oxidoreductase [Opitutaceae bacterium]|nr:NAD(P)H-dependent oxidoreductase [Opitutaceae bacterium]